jgi:hypothetical protein
MNLNEMFPSNYLSKNDLPAPRVLVMTKVTKEEVWRKNGKQTTIVLHLEGSKPMILNKTNAVMIARSYGADSVAWVGKSIEIYHDPNVMLGRERIGGIRVRIPTGSRLLPGAGARTNNVNSTMPKTVPAPIASSPAPTLEQRHAQLLAGFDGALTEENLRAWGRWGNQFPFTEPQQSEAEERFHDGLERIAQTQPPHRRQTQASA